MKPYIEPIHIKKYAGKRVMYRVFPLGCLVLWFNDLWVLLFSQVGIDAYSWLHKGGNVLASSLLQRVIFWGTGGCCYPFVDTASLYQLIRVVWRFALTLIVIRNGDT